MNIVYAFRREACYPHHGMGTVLPPEKVRGAYLGKVREMGFDGLEVGANLPDGGEVTEAAVTALRRELEDAGVPCMSVRGGGGMTHPRTAAGNREGLKRVIRFASWIGAAVVNSTTGTGHRHPGGPGSFVGEPVSQGSSRFASEDDFERTARAYAEAADFAAEHDIHISIEVHQHSISDNSWSAGHLLDLIDRPNVWANPDLGNIYWCYNEPEESCEDAIVALASRTKYWHCKNLTRVLFRGGDRAIFLQVPLPDGDIDYRFALSALLEAGFDGYIAVEGIRLGDQYYGDQKSISYMRGLLAELTQGAQGGE